MTVPNSMASAPMAARAATSDCVRLPGRLGAAPAVVAQQATASQDQSTAGRARGDRGLGAAPRREPADHTDRHHGVHRRSPEARNLDNVTDIGAYVPSAVIAPLGAGWGATMAAFIRGVGLGDNILSFEPGVPIYVDDVYIGRPQGAMLRPAGPRARRSAARPAGHAVRQERRGRHGPPDLGEAAGR